MKHLAVVGVALALAGCAQGLSRQAVLSGLVGLPEADAVRVLGVPTRTYETGGRKFLAFTEQRLDLAPAPPLFYGGWPYGGYGFGYAPPQAIQRVCETTLEVVDGRVTSWSLRGNAC